jgi:hypothetical protein
MSEDSTMPGAPEPQQTRDSIEPCADQPEGLLDRRAALGLSVKWSMAALAAILAGAGLLDTEEEAEAAVNVWVNRRGGGGWVNRRGWGGWGNRRPGGSWWNGRGGWVNRRGPGGSWLNLR